MTDPIAAIYDDFGRRWAHDTSPLYEDWATGIAADPAVLDLLHGLPQAKHQPNLIFAAARWAGCPLAPYAEWRGWLIAEWDEVREVALSRATQTNEVNRCATTLPVLSRLDGPLALLEVGTAAGFCLYPDRYSVTYETPTGPRMLMPDAGDSPVQLACRLDDAASAPTSMPEIVWRRGIDLNPIDAADADAIDWLAALVWPGPDHDARVARLRAATALVAQDPPTIVRGDLLEHLTDVAASSPHDATLVLFHSAVLLYLDPGQRRRFADLVEGLGEAIGRRLVWLSNETKGTLPEIDAQIPDGLETAHRFVQTVDGIPVALAGQHGAVYETRAFRPEGPLA